MRPTRRGLLKIVAGGAVAGGALPGCAKPPHFEPRKPLGKTRTICPYCAVGCGMVVSTKDGKVVHIEGDAAHPISEGGLCSKGSSLLGTINSPARVTRPRYRAPGASRWTEVGWDWALDRIAKLTKKTRDAGWIEKDARGRTVRRTEAIAHVGSAALDNEECILIVKAMRALGLCYIEHQARI